MADRRCGRGAIAFDQTKNNQGNPMGKLADILRVSRAQQQSVDELKQRWDETDAAGDYEPLPVGSYECRLILGELTVSSGGHPEYKLTFEVSDGEFAGRRFWHSLYLTPAAMPLARRDLGKLGITAVEDLEQPLPCIFICRVSLVIHKTDTGTEFNRVVRLECLGQEEHPVDPFAPQVDTSPAPRTTGSGGVQTEPEDGDIPSLKEMLGGSDE
jgi:hypothetical protein